MDDYLGQQLGNYRVLRLLGEGGFARVYLGEHVFLKTQAAIKVLTTKLGQEEMAHFLSEAQTIARLRHPNIVRVLEFGVQGTIPFLVMDYAPNGTLRQRHPRGMRLTLDVVSSYVQQVAEALQYAHEEKLVHRDIKPENMLIGPRNEVLLSDFGIATVAQSSRYESNQDVAGTVAYMAPEQIQGHPRPSSDLYSLGVVVYEWLSGERPFQGTFTEIAVQHTIKPPPPLREKVPTLSPMVEQVVLTALEKDPRARFANMRAFASALANAGRMPSVPLPQPSGLPSSGAVPGVQLPPSFPPLLTSTPSLTPPPTLSTSQTSFQTRQQPPSGSLPLVSQTPQFGATPQITPQVTPFAPTAIAPPNPPRRKGRALALVGAVLALLVVVGGLGGAGYYFFALKHTTPTPGPMPAAMPYPYTVPTHKGGTITYGSPYYANTTNPWFANYVGDYDLINALWGSPLIISSSGGYLPDELAEIPTQANGDVSKDGLTVVMKLRHDLRWSDGQPLTADDFVYWLHVELDPQTAGIYSTNGIDQLASYKTQDPYTLILTYKQVFAPYLAYLPYAAPSHVWQSIPDSGLAATQNVALTPQVTSGPFMLTNYTAGDTTSGPRFDMAPNPYYASTTLHASVLNRLVFQEYYDLPSAIQAYRQGQLDEIENLQSSDLSNLQGVQGLRITPTIGYAHLDFNLTNPALQNVSVRKAIEEAVDRCQIIQQVLQQSCSTLRVDTILPKPSPDFDSTNQTYTFNLTQARADMQTAGWDCSSGTCTRNGKPFPTLRLATYNSDIFGAIAALIEQNLNTLGLSVSVMPADNLLADFTQGGVLAKGTFDLALFDYAFTIDSDANLYSSFHSSEIPSAQNPTGANYERINDMGVDQLLDEGRATLDSARRSQIYKDAQRILIQKVYVIPLFLEPNITVTSAIIGNYLRNPTFLGNEWNVGDWYRTK